MFKGEIENSKDEILIVDSTINELLLPLFYISTYCLSLIVCQEQNFDFQEVREERTDKNDPKKEKKNYISLFCSRRMHGKLKAIILYLTIGYAFEELTDNFVKTINLNKLKLNWTKFSSIYSEKRNEFWPFPTYIIRTFIKLHYKNID